MSAMIDQLARVVEHMLEHMFFTFITLVGVSLLILLNDYDTHTHPSRTYRAFGSLDQESQL